MNLATAGSLRMIRGASVGALALGVSVGGHVLAGGSFGVSTALTMGAISTGAGVATAGRKFTFIRAFTVVAALQPLLHVVQTGSGAHVHEAAALPTQSDIDMVATHLAATVTSAAAMAALDRFIWQWLRDALPLTAVAAREVVPRVDTAGDWAPQVFSHVQKMMLISPWRGPPICNSPHPS